MKGGELYNQSEIDGDLDRIKTILGTQGHEAQARAVPVYSQDKPGLVQVRYEVEERAPARVGQIFIVGNDRTQQNVILRQVPLYPGQVLNYPAIREGEQPLARLNIFNSTPDGSVKPTITVLDNPNDPDNPYKDILVSVQEASTGSLMFGLGVNSDSGLTGLDRAQRAQLRPVPPADELRRLPQRHRLPRGRPGVPHRGRARHAAPALRRQPPRAVPLRQPLQPDGLRLLLPAAPTTSTTRTASAAASRSAARSATTGASSPRSASRTSTSAACRSSPRPTTRASSATTSCSATRIGAVRDTRNSVIRPTDGSLLDVGSEYVTGDYNFPLASAELTQVLHDLPAGRQHRPAGPLGPQPGRLGRLEHPGLRALLRGRLPLDPRLRVPRRRPGRQRLQGRRRLHGPQQPRVPGAGQRQGRHRPRRLRRLRHGRRSGRTTSTPTASRPASACGSSCRCSGRCRSPWTSASRSSRGRRPDAGVQLLHGLDAVSGGVAEGRSEAHRLRPAGFSR